MVAQCQLRDLLTGWTTFVGQERGAAWYHRVIMSFGVRLLIPPPYICDFG